MKMNIRIGMEGKKKYAAAALLLIAAVCIGLLAACGGQQETEAEAAIQDSGEQTDGTQVDEAETGDIPAEADQSDSVQTDGEASQADGAGQTELDEMAEETVGRKLTEAELQEYTEWIQDVSNYGFLLSDWQEPTQINLFEVFYGGAGISHGGTEEQKQAYLNRYGEEEIYTDFWVIDKADMDIFLLEKVGCTYDELFMKGNKSLEGIYYPEADCFCLQAGDTNYCMFTCTDGVLNEEGTEVTLQCEGDYWVSKCETVVNIAGGTKAIVRNHITEGSILDEEAFTEEPACLIDQEILNNPKFEADASAVENNYVLGDWSRITKEALQGTWYHHPKSEGESKQYDVVLKFDGDEAMVYYPSVDFYAETSYEWDIVDRSDRGLCPELAIYFRETKDAPLAWYILGISENRNYFWCNGEVFYRQ